MVAKLSWWRDAGPVDVDAESMWGEGCYLLLTHVGIDQFIAVRSKVAINVFASRQTQQPSGYGKSFFEAAKNSYSL